jgi:hypothetical protein
MAALRTSWDSSASCSKSSEPIPSLQDFTRRWLQARGNPARRHSPAPLRRRRRVPRCVATCSTVQDAQHVSRRYTRADGCVRSCLCLCLFCCCADAAASRRPLETAREHEAESRARGAPHGRRRSDFGGEAVDRRPGMVQLLRVWGEREVVEHTPRHLSVSHRISPYPAISGHRI